MKPHICIHAVQLVSLFRAGHVLPCRYKGVHKHKKTGKFGAHLWVGTTVLVTVVSELEPAVYVQLDDVTTFAMCQLCRQ
jgi:hypothetical protein